MGARGPAAKDPGRRQRREEPKGTLAIAYHEWLDKPAPRRNWLRVVKQEWEELWSDGLHRVFMPTDVPELYRLFGLKDERERCDRSVRKGVVVEDGDGHLVRVSAMLVPGSTGQMVLNPLLKHRGRLDIEILALADRFALNLKARLGQGIDAAKLAKSLDQLNAVFADDDGDDDDQDDAVGAPDPRADLALVQLPGPDPGREAAS